MYSYNFILLLFTLNNSHIAVHSFTTQNPSTSATLATPAPTKTSIYMGWFDAINKAFSNEQYSTPAEGIKATARHILVKNKEDLQVVYNALESGTPFSTVAQQYSTCPSGRSSGGSLGSFRPGNMVQEFDQVVFNSDTNIGEVVGPVETQFGYHLIVVDKRTGI